MKSVSLTLLVICCVLRGGTAHASTAYPGAQRSSANSSTATGDHSSDAKQTTAASEKRSQKSTASDEARNSRVSNKIHSHNRIKLTKTNRSKQVHRSHEHTRPENVMRGHQLSLTKPASPTSRIGNHSRPPSRPAAGAGISGEQFRNDRQRSVNPAVVSGSVNQKRNTATLNGTNMNRKRLN